MPITERQVVRQRSFLARWWGVRSHKDIIETMAWLKNEGHRAEFEKMKSEAGELAQPAPVLERKALAGYRDRADFVQRNAVRLGEKSLVGWDLSRLISVARWGVSAEYLTEEEAWDWIMPAAQELQKTYSSWEELGESYLDGRFFWSQRRTPKNVAEYKSAVYWLTTNEFSPWVKFDWNLDLKGSAEPIAAGGKVPEPELYYQAVQLDREDLTAEALEVLTRVISEGSVFAKGNAYDKLGDFYSAGRPGLKVDKAKAFRFYEQGAALQNDQSLGVVGLSYYSGKMVKKDFVKAMDCWKRAAEQGNEVGLCNVGLLYAEGKGVQKNPEKARDYYKLATIHGSDTSENNLAWLMLNTPEIWDADEAVRLAAAGVHKLECDYHYNTLTRVLIKAERWGEATESLDKWERFNMRQRNDYDPLKLPAKFKKLRARVEAGQVG